MEVEVNPLYHFSCSAHFYPLYPFCLLHSLPTLTVRTAQPTLTTSLLYPSTSSDCSNSSICSNRSVRSAHYASSNCSTLSIHLTSLPATTLPRALPAFPALPALPALTALPTLLTSPALQSSTICSTRPSYSSALPALPALPIFSIQHYIKNGQYFDRSTMCRVDISPPGTWKLVLKLFF
jgi:hypothetical protein